MKIFKLLFILLLFLSFNNTWADYVAWDLNEDAEFYKVYIKTADDEDFKEAYTTESATQLQVDMKDILYNNEPLMENIEYFLSVKAFNACGNSSDFSDSITYLIYKPAIPVPTITKNKLTWTYSDTIESNPGKFIIEIGMNGSSMFIDVNGTDRSYDLSKLILPNNATYPITITACANSGVCGEASSPVSYTRRSPSKVNNVRVIKTSVK